jgi:hypothetical protein
MIVFNCPALLVIWLLALGSVQADDYPDPSWSGNSEGLALAQLILDRPASSGRVGIMHFHLTNKRGRSRERAALMAHSEIEGTTRVAIYFSSPASIQNTGFLSHEHEAREDDSWLYLPATERVRRLPASERADPFMGTDLSYGDIRDNFRFPIEHWQFRAGERVEEDGRELRLLQGRARSSESAREMGYGRFEALIDETSLFPVRIDYFDIHDQALKQVTVSRIGQVGEAWTALAFEVQNHQTGHRTEVFFEDMRYVPDLSDRVFQPTALADGLPRIP